ncbi:MAG: hypothetical protein ABIK07_04105, partial [Planctomycetota bacterium]
GGSNPLLGNTKKAPQPGCCGAFFYARHFISGASDRLRTRIAFKKKTPGRAGLGQGMNGLPFVTD